MVVGLKKKKKKKDFFVMLLFLLAEHSRQSKKKAEKLEAQNPISSDIISHSVSLIFGVLLFRTYDRYLEERLKTLKVLLISIWIHYTIMAS